MAQRPPAISNLAYNIGMVIGAMRAASSQLDADAEEWVVVSEERSVVAPLTADDIAEGGVYVTHASASNWRTGQLGRSRCQPGPPIGRMVPRGPKPGGHSGRRSADRFPVARGTQSEIIFGENSGAGVGNLA